MPEELGRMEKPAAESFQAARKLLFVPLIFTPPETDPALRERVNRYWAQVEAQVANLEARLGGVRKVYHELVPAGGDEGVKAIAGLNQGSYELIRPRLERGAELQPMEDAELLEEFIDWGRCLAAGLQSRKVLARVFESYAALQKSRNEHIARRLDETLQGGEMGLLLMTEGHGVQFSADMQVFYVAPPALDQLKRWLREREEQGQSSPEGEPGQPK